MMDSAADDLMTASIGRSPRNDTSGGSDPPGSSSGAQADLDGLPLDHATKPASTEAQLRHQCQQTRPLWHMVLKFCRDVLRAPDMRGSVERAIIFNQANPKEMLPVAACAFIRHAFNCFYHDFANVDKGHAFVRERVYYDALISFRSAVLRHAHRMRLLYVHRVRTSLPETVSEEDREKFECVVTISPTGKATLSTTFTAAIDAALARLKALPS